MIGYFGLINTFKCVCIKVDKKIISWRCMRTPIVTAMSLLELMMQGLSHMRLGWHTWATQGSIVRGDSGGSIVARLPFRHICFKGPPD